MIQDLVLRNVATYDDAGISINNLKHINYIYGINGTGKTTISNFIQNPSDNGFNDCQIVWHGGVTEKTLVYNKRFRERNFGKGKTAGVFTLGEATKEQIDEIDRLKKELDEVKANLIQKRATLEAQKAKKIEEEESFKETVWVDIYKNLETDFKEAFQGYLKKNLFMEKLLSENRTNKSELRTIEYLKEKGSVIFGDVPELLAKYSDIDVSVIIEIERNDIWAKRIIGKNDVSIAALIQKLGINDWVNEGKAYIQKDSKICPFCQSDSISEKFKADLENYFDETYVNDIKLVNRLCSDYINEISSIKSRIEAIQSSEEKHPTDKIDIELFNANVKSFLAQTTKNAESFENKKKEPSRSFNINESTSTLAILNTIIAEANEKISTHNAIVNNYPSERSKLIAEIWKYILSFNSELIASYVKKIEGLASGIKAIEDKISNLEGRTRELGIRIREANKNITSIQPSIDEINRILKEYGFLNFEIVESRAEKNFYIIQREDGTNAELTLSEGEITFITFLYFLQLAKGSNTEENITNDRILIIDDPISSLDSNVLFVICSLLKDIIRDIRNERGIIKQIFVLTHNVYFHKEVSFIDGKTRECNKTNFWMLRKAFKTSSISFFGMKNPIQNSYELLWNELKTDCEVNIITIQNTMRRIIENYFKLLGKYGDDDLIKSFSNREEQEICRSLLCWINDGSHCIPDDLFIEHQADTVMKYKDVFKKIFINTKHEEHYKMMMGIVETET